MKNQQPSIDYQPTAAQVKVVIDNFLSVASKYPDCVVSMHEPTVCSRKHKCGTVHCHAGLYAVAMIEQGRISKEYVAGRSGIDWGAGVEGMSEDLGFPAEDYAELEAVSGMETWADTHPVEWGNAHGANMFESKEAFYHATRRPNGAESVQDIVDHWRDVRCRLLKLERMPL